MSSKERVRLRIPRPITPQRTEEDHVHALPALAPPKTKFASSGLGDTAEESFQMPELALSRPKKLKPKTENKPTSKAEAQSEKEDQGPDQDPQAKQGEGKDQSGAGKLPSFLAFSDRIAQFKLIPRDLPPSQFNETEQSVTDVKKPELENHDFEAKSSPEPAKLPEQASNEIKAKADAEAQGAAPKEVGNDKPKAEVKMPEIKQGPARDKPAPKSAAKPQRRSPANGIPDSVRSKMEAVFKIDVSAVKIVENSSAAKEAGALAFAAGDTLHFAPGQFNPNSPQGQQLLGHELAHLVQQKQGRVQATGEMNGMAVNNDKALEAEADAMGAQLVNSPEASAEATEAATTAPILASSGAAPVSQLQDDGSNLYAAYQDLLAWAIEQKSKIAEDTTTLKETVTQLGDGQKQTISDLVDAQVQRMKDAIKTAQDHIRTTTSTARTTITTHREAKITEVNTTADTEIAGIQTLIDDKKKALIDRGETHATGIVNHAETQAARAIDQSNANSTQVNTVITSTAANYRDRDGVEQAVTEARGNVTVLTARFTEMGDTMATEVRSDANGMATDIRQEAVEAGSHLDRPLADATEQIDRKRNETVTAIQGSGESLLTTLEQETQESIAALEQQVGTQEASIRSYADGTSETVERAVTDAHTLIDEQMQNAGNDIDTFVQSLEEIGWYSSEVEAAKADLEAALAAHRADIDAKTQEVTTNFEQHQSEVQSGTDELTSAIESTVAETCTAFDNEVNPKVEEIKGELDTMTTTATDEIKSVRPALEPALDSAIEDTESKWAENVEAAESDISTKVDAGLERQQTSLSDFSSQINEQFSSLPSKDRGFWESVWEGIKDVGAFIGGVFVGIFHAIGDLLMGILDIIRTPAKWLAAAVVIIVAVIAIAIIAAFAGISFGLAALIVGAIVGVCFMAYYFYQAATTEGLSPYERGELVGRGIFEGIMAFAGTGVWGRLGSWAGRISRIGEMMNAVGGLRNFLKMAVWVDDVDRLIMLINRVENIGELSTLFGRLSSASEATKLLDIVEHLGDASRIASFFGRGGEIAGILNKIDDVGKFVEIMNRVEDAAQLSNILTVGRFRNISELHALMELTSVRDLETLSRLLENAGSIDNLMEMARRLQRLTLEEAQSAVQNLKPNQRGPVQSGVLDTMFPEAGPFFGRNASEIPADLYPLLRDRLAQYLPIRQENLARLTDQELNAILRAGEPGAHSELYALSQALWNRHNELGLGERFLTESALSEFLLNNVALRGSRTLTGAPPRCVNCNFLTNGMTLVGIDETATFSRLFNGAGGTNGIDLAQLADPNIFQTVIRLLTKVDAAQGGTNSNDGN
jgi:Domain of unknown function (DUF4157)